MSSKTILLTATLSVTVGAMAMPNNARFPDSSATVTTVGHGPQIRAGGGIPANAQLPVLAAVTVDYRNDEGRPRPSGREPAAIGGTVWETFDGPAGGRCTDGVTACEADDQCDPPNAGSCQPQTAGQLGACCDDLTGNCVEVAGPEFCLGADNKTWQGQGTNCDPNCCVQPVFTGGDTCLEAVVHTIPVPAPGDSPYYLTITGNNSTATYGDYSGGTCTMSVFDEDGVTRDPGWWEAFEIMECAHVRLELCCSEVGGTTWRPNWVGLWGSCNDCLENGQGPDVVPQPIGLGMGFAGSGRGSPFCDEDNLWMTYELPPGTYFYPIYSAPGGTGASPPGGQYQLNIIVGACPAYLCCYPGGCAVINQMQCDAVDGYWAEGVTECGTNCDTGTCCYGPGECIDGLFPMTEADCDILGGVYVGYALCDSSPPPCPVCDMEGVGNCQLPDLGSGDATMMSDRSFPLTGVVVADDFVPQSETIDTICTWGNYLDPVAILAAGAGNYGGDCNDEVTDDFRVTVFTDLLGKPDTVLGWSDATVVAKGPVDSLFGWPSFPDSQTYTYQMTLDVPITGMDPGTTYWVEIANNTVLDELGEEDGNTCYWHWAQTSIVTNNFHYVGNDWEAKAQPYLYGGGRSGPAGDMSFCLNLNFDDPPDVSGACCDCDDGTCLVTTLDNCNGQWEQNGDCTGDCSTLVPGDVCAVNPIVTSDPNFTYTFDTSCTDTDGPDSENSELGIIDVGKDIWVHYTAPCYGKVYVDTCGTGNADNSYDSAMAVYKDATDSTRCVCPGDAGMTLVDLAQDESCNGISDGGAGMLPTPVETGVGDCLTVRVAGYHSDSGTGTIKISCEEAVCPPPDEPLPDPRIPDIGNGTRSRYLCFDPPATATPQTTAIRVTLTDLPPGYENYEGDQWWVGEPVGVTELSGGNASAPLPTFWAAGLECEQNHFADWTTYGGPICVHSPGIIPGARYELQAISESCDQGDESNYSLPLAISTSALGDLVGSGCGNCSCDPPDGTVSFVDISVVVDKFRNLACAGGSGPSVPLKSRADMVNSVLSMGDVDLRIDFVDISSVVGAFRNQPPTLPGPQVHCPGP